MSVNSYQNEVSRLQRDIGDLRSKMADKNKQIANVNQDIASAMKSISSASSQSSRDSAMSRLVSKQKDGARAGSELADLEKRLASKSSDLGRAQGNLARAQEQEMKKQDDEFKKRAALEKKRTEEQLKSAKEVTRNYEKQAALQSHMRRQAMLDIANLPEKIKVLFCAADPKSPDRLHLSEEVRSITDRIQASKHRNSVELTSIWAVRSNDLMQALNEHEPHIVHFSGHGSDGDEIVFLNSAGDAKFISKTAIVEMLASSAANLRVVVFNTCFSENQAREMTRHVEAAIGMSDEIGDEAARNFASQFYSAIGFGLSIQQAFNQARAFLSAEVDDEAHIPVLFTQDGIDANEIILVKPS